MVTTVATGKRDRRDTTLAGPVFDFTNFTEQLAINCDSASNDQLADALATLVKTLMQQGLLQGTVKTA